MSHPLQHIGQAEHIAFRAARHEVIFVAEDYLHAGDSLCLLSASHA